MLAKENETEKLRSLIYWNSKSFFIWFPEIKKCPQFQKKDSPLLFVIGSIISNHSPIDIGD